MSPRIPKPKRLPWIHNKPCAFPVDYDRTPNSSEQNKSNTVNSTGAPPIKKKYKGGFTRDKAVARWYNTIAWKRLRNRHISKQPLCQSCKRKGQVKAGGVVDHIRPIRLGGAMYDEGNLQTLCVPCHNSKSARERGLQGWGGDITK